MRYIVLIAMLLCACSRYDASEADPGYGQALDWIAPEHECPAERRVIDCEGGERATIIVRESCVTVRNCHVLSRVRIYGEYSSADNIPPDFSRSPRYVAGIRAQAPWLVTFENCTFEAETGQLPVYVGPGVTRTTFRDCVFRGPSRSTLLYLGAESGWTTIEGCTFDADEAAREAIAVDASSHNVIRDSRFIGGSGIYLYRNCGQDGVIRHEIPRKNRIIGNVFEDSDPAVWLSSRDDDWKAYCAFDDWQDSGGSSRSNWSHAMYNTVANNDLNGGRIIEGESARDNIIEDNMP